MLFLMLIGCSWGQRAFADDMACSDGESQGFTDGFNHGYNECEYDDDVPDAQLLDYPDAYAASSFVACYKEGYASGYREGELDESGAPGSACD